MMGHISEYCKTPSTIFRRLGAVWGCDCGKVYRLTKAYGFCDTWKEWQLIQAIEKELK